MLDAFFDEVLPTAGYSVIASIDGKNPPKHYATHTPRDTIERLDAEGLNTFMSLGGYLEGDDIVTKENKVEHLKGTCPFVRSFVFDLDVEVDNPKKYGTIEEAVAGLQSAIDDKVIPLPRWVVFSGGGLHFYYVLGHAVEESAWSPVCEGLRNACTMSGLKIDRAVGTYPYRLIRAPGTHNHKTDPAIPVRLHPKPGPMHTLEELAAYCKLVPSKTYEGKKTDKDFIPVEPEQLFKACPRIKELHDTGGTLLDQREWFHLANNMALTSGGSELFHEFSCKHKTYEYNYVEEFWQRVSSEYSDAPSKCLEFDSDVCKICPHYGKGISPIQAARSITHETPELAAAFAKVYVPPTLTEEEQTLPDGYNRQGDALYFHDDLVSSYFTVGRAQFNAVTQTAVVTLTRHTGATCVFPLKALGREGTTAAELSNLGIRVLLAEPANMYIKDISMKHAPLMEHVSLGWNEKLDMFIAPNGVLPNLETLMASQNLKKVTDDWKGKRGSLKLWMKSIGMLQYEGQEPMLMTVLASLASPLLEYLDLEKGMIYSMQGDKGMGKTTVMRIANSVWGKPLSTIVTSKDTYKSMRKKIALNGNLPMTMDETTLTSSEDMQNLAFEISQGTGRARLQQTGDLAEDEKWWLIAISNSNNSIHEKLLDSPIGDGADLTRVFEVQIDRKKILSHPQASAAEGQVMSDKINENYGHLGDAFIAWLLDQDRAELIEKSRHLRRELKKRFSLDGSYRFYECLIVACYIAHIGAKEIDNNFPGMPLDMYEWMQMQLMTNKESIVSMTDVRMPSVDNFLIEFEQDGNIKRPTEDGMFEVWGTAFKGTLYQFDSHVYVPIEAFKAWAFRQHVQVGDLIKRWSESGHLVPVKNIDGRDPLYKGRSPKGIKIHGETLFPTVIIIHREQEAGNAQITEKLQERIN